MPKSIVKRDSEIIKEKLQKLYPKIRFSAKRYNFAGGHSVAVTVVSGNIKAFKEGTNKDDYYNVNIFHYKDSEDLTPEMIKVIDDIIAVAQQENNFLNRHSSSYLHINIGSYKKPYVYNESAKVVAGGSGGGRFTNLDYGVFEGDCTSGWNIYFKTFTNGSTVYNVVKNKDVPVNKTDWAEIRGAVTTATGFKWSPKTQSFQKWGSLTNKAEIFEKLCEVLSKYYPTQITTTQAQASTPTSTSQATTTSVQHDKISELVANSLVNELLITERAIALNYCNNDILQIVENPDKDINRPDDIGLQNHYIKEIIRVLKGFSDELKATTASQRELIWNKLRDNQIKAEKISFVDEVLYLLGFFGEKVRDEAIETYSKDLGRKHIHPDRVPFDRSFLPIEERTSQNTSQEVDKNQVNSAIKALQYLANAGNVEAQQAINALKYLL